MDLTAALLRQARPSVFMLTAPGATACRLAVERVVQVRGYRQAVAPAQANILLACGELDGDLMEVADRVWTQLPLPAARGTLSVAAQAEHVLDRTVAELVDSVRQRRAAAVSAAPPIGTDHDTGGHDMAGMKMPGGIGMAERGPDRDGLSLDQLHVPLGPALSDWPTGLRLQLVLQGDVVQKATCEMVGSAPESTPFWTVHNAPTAALDSLQRMLGVAGWSAAALSARRFRDELLDRPAAAPPQLGRWARRVRRSRLLRWSTDGLGVFTEPGGTRTDATARWLRWLDEAAGAPAPPRAVGAHAHLDALAGLLVGQELAAVRLIVASLDPDIEAMIATGERHD